MRRLHPAALLIASALAAWSCRAERPPAPEVAGASFPRTVTLASGEEIAIPAPPRRIAIANTALVDYAALLVPPGRIAAVCSYAHKSSLIALRAADDPLRRRPTFHNFAAEPVLAHDPDLVLCDIHNRAETRAALLAAEIPVVCVPFATDLAGVRANVTLVARLLGEDERAVAALRELDARIARLRAMPRRDQRALYYLNDGSGGVSFGSETLAHCALELAGLTNAAGEAGSKGWVRLSFEQLLAIDPDVVVVEAGKGGEPGTAERVLRTEPALAKLRAVQRGAYVRLHPALFSTSSPEIVTAAEHIARALTAELPAGDGR